MMYNSREHAMRGLKAYLDKHKMEVRLEPIGEQQYSEAEMLLVRTVDHWTNHVKRGNFDYKEFRRLVGIARCLGLYPIPEWYKAQQRLMKSGRGGVVMYVEYDGKPLDIISVSIQPS